MSLHLPNKCNKLFTGGHKNNNVKQQTPELKQTISTELITHVKTITTNKKQTTQHSSGLHVIAVSVVNFLSIVSHKPSTMKYRQLSCNE